MSDIFLFVLHTTTHLASYQHLGGEVGAIVIHIYSKNTEVQEV